MQKQLSNQKPKSPNKEKRKKNPTIPLKKIGPRQSAKRENPKAGDRSKLTGVLSGPTYTLSNSCVMWKPIKETEDRYEASSDGQIRHVIHKRIRKQFVKNGYMAVSLRVFSKGKLVEKSTKVHRLVCSAFHENPENKPIVSHKDTNCLNNNADNLEWATVHENYASGRKNGKYPAYRKPCFIKEEKRDTRLVLNKETGIFYFGASQAAKSIGKGSLIMRRWLHKGKSKNFSFTYI